MFIDDSIDASKNDEMMHAKFSAVETRVDFTSDFNTVKLKLIYIFLNIFPHHGSSVVQCSQSWAFECRRSGFKSLTRTTE